MGLWDRNLLLPDSSKRVQESSGTGDFSLQPHNGVLNLRQLTEHVIRPQHFFLYELVRFPCGDKLDRSLFPAENLKLYYTN